MATCSAVPVAILGDTSLRDAPQDEGFQFLQAETRPFGVFADRFLAANLLPNIAFLRSRFGLIQAVFSHRSDGPTEHPHRP
jgi:hypothetical protein